jgi:F0F1-type ATP synthase membrane subunit b/b'
MNNNSSISAINEVLIAEQQNKSAITVCKQQADNIIEDARMKARRINERADERITNVHKIADSSIQAQVSKLNLQMASLHSQYKLDENDHEKLNNAIAMLVQELVGDDK